VTKDDNVAVVIVTLSSSMLNARRSSRRHSLVVDVIGADRQLAEVVGDTNNVEKAKARHDQTNLALISLKEFHAKSGMFLPTTIAKQIADFVSNLHGELARMTLANYRNPHTRHGSGGNQLQC
jgi:capsule polysaccharide export protein KpsE/RkpR